MHLKDHPGILADLGQTSVIGLDQLPIELGREEGIGTVAVSSTMLMMSAFDYVNCTFKKITNYLNRLTAMR